MASEKKAPRAAGSATSANDPMSQLMSENWEPVLKHISTRSMGIQMVIYYVNTHTSPYELYGGEEKGMKISTCRATMADIRKLLPSGLRANSALLPLFNQAVKEHQTKNKAHGTFKNFVTVIVLLVQGRPGEEHMSAVGGGVTHEAVVAGKDAKVVNAQ